MAETDLLRAAWDAGPVTLESVTPPGYAHLSLAVIDAIFSIRANYTTARNVVVRYAARFGVPDVGFADRGEDERGLPFLSQSLQSCSDAELVELFGNRQRTGRRLKATAVPEVAAALIDAGVTCSSDIVRIDADRDRAAEQRRAWCSVTGCGPVTWRYVRLLAGLPDVKPDTMVTRWTSRALGRDVSAEQAASLLESLADSLDADRRVVDHAIWRYERRPGSGRS